MPDRPEFDRQPHLTSATLDLRPLSQGDYRALYQAASDPAIWAGHPAKQRHQPAVFEPYFQTLLDSAATLVVRDAATHQVIGCSRYYDVPDVPDSIGIGFTFLTTPYWGGDTNFELKRLMLNHVFASYDNVWFHIGPDNIRSQKATKKLGAVFQYQKDLFLSGGGAATLCFKLAKTGWQRTVDARR